MTEQERTWLACHALGVTSAKLLAYPELLDAPEVRALFRRRESGEPLQYILGTAPFFGRDFRVGPGVLIPRRDTETLIEAAQSFFPSETAFTFLDWGTGSGCIAATLLLEFPNSAAIMAERSPAAIGYARENLACHHLEGRATILESQAPDDITVNDCDFVVSNPPYIPRHEIPGLMREVRDHEPIEALDGGADGLDCYRLLFQYAPRWLKPGGLLILEMGSAAQSEALRSPGFQHRHNPKGLTFVREFLDDSAIPRCAVWQYPGSNEI